jgi:hypothetical protein
MRAVNHLQDPECAFVVTHEDLTYPGPNPDIIVPAVYFLYFIENPKNVSNKKLFNI